MIPESTADVERRRETMSQVNVFQGHGNHNVAASLYASEALRVASSLRREGVYVCHANIIARMSNYNLEILNNVLWSLSIGGQL
jgi:hypothetical protein